MVPNVHDTLIVDTARIAMMRADEQFAYTVTEERESLLRQFFRGILEGLRWLFSVDVPFIDKLWIIVYTLLAVVLLVWLCTNKAFRGLFRRNAEQSLTIDEAERDIHAIDFDRELAAARSRSDYLMACRLTYLQTLKRLADAGRIAWEPFKTPTQYTYEEPSHAFSELTQWFLRVRYGNYAADEQTLTTMTALRDAATKGGNA